MRTHNGDVAETFMRGLKKLPVLDREEELRLAREYRKTGDEKAAKRLVEGHLRLVIKIAKECCHQQGALPDLIQEGCVGLMRAVEKYEPDRGVRLSSYAAWWIRAHIYQHIMANARIMRVATTFAQRKLFFSLRREWQRIAQTGEEASAAKVAERLGVSEADVVEMTERLGARDVSYEATVEVGGAEEPDGTSLDAEVEDQELRAAVRERMRALDEDMGARERVIYEQRLCADEPLTLQEVGQRLGLSRERARQLEARLKSRLRSHLAPLFGNELAQQAA